MSADILYYSASAWFVFVVSLVFALWQFVKFGKSTFNIWSKQGIPGPKPLPWLGNYLDILRKKKFIYYQTLIEKYGKVVGFYAGKTPALLVTDPELLNEILIRQFSKFNKRGSPGIIPYFTKGLLFCESNEWKRLRRSVNPVFTSSKMKEMSHDIQFCNKCLVDGLEVHATSGRMVDISRMFSKFTMKVLLRTAFGVEETGNDDFIDAAESAFKFNPFLFLLISCFPFLKSFMEHKIVPKSLHAIASAAKQIIRIRQEIGQPERRDLLASLMTTETDNGKMKCNLNEEEVIGQSVTFLFAGSRTTSNTLSFLCHELANHPDVQEKLIAEIDKINAPGNKLTDYDVINQAVYLDMVLKETMRLYPPTFQFTRVCTESCTINGINFQKGMSVVVPIYAIHRDAQHWQDPELFNPERFSGDGKLSADSFHYLPFGVGPRHCIGQRFALLETKLLMIEILKKYRFQREGIVALELGGRNSLEPKDGVNLRILRRR